MRRKKLYAFALLHLVLAPVCVYADEEICPPSSIESAAPDLQMKESDFYIERALGSLKYLESDVPEMISRSEEELFQIIRGEKSLGDIPLEFRSVSYSEQYYLYYYNNIKLLRGTLLKYHYLYLKEKFENMPEHEQGASMELEKAKKELCDFVAKAIYDD